MIPKLWHTVNFFCKGTTEYDVLNKVCNAFVAAILSSAMVQAKNTRVPGEHWQNRRKQLPTQLGLDINHISQGNSPVRPGFPKGTTKPRGESKIHSLLGPAPLIPSMSQVVD
jgi:hypothetical protein